MGWECLLSLNITYFLIPKRDLIRRRLKIIPFLFLNIQSSIFIQSQDRNYIRRAILINYFVFNARNIVIFRIITLLIIFLNISCRINITWYIYIIAFGTSASLDLLSLRAAKTDNHEIGIIKFNNFYLWPLSLYLSRSF